MAAPIAGGVVRGAWCGILFLAAVALAGGCAGRPRAGLELTAQAYEIHVDGAPPAPSAGLVVASYNVHQMARTAALRMDLASLPFVDVWAMQEVPVPRPRHNADDDEGESAAAHRQAFRQSMKKILPPGTWHVRAVAVNPIEPDAWTCEGQLIASRLPIHDSAVWPLGGEGKRRVALAAFIEHGADGAAGTVAVVNTDHEPGFFSAAGGNDAQVARLVTHLARCDGPAVVVGDFNPTGSLWRLRSHAQHVARLRSGMTRAGFATAPHVDHDTFRGFPSRLRLDHLFLRDLHWLAGGVAVSARGSDHLPVWCRVRPLPRDEKDDVFGCAGY